MKVVLTNIELQTLPLPPQQRSELIHILIASLDGPMEDSPKTIAKAWEEEIDRRIDNMDAGRTKWIPGDEALACIRARISEAKAVPAA